MGTVTGHFSAEQKFSSQGFKKWTLGHFGYVIKFKFNFPAIGLKISLKNSP